jgi:hypothetical protein
MYLTQLEKLFIASHIGGHPENEPLPPMKQEESGPRFPYSAVRDRIKDYAPPVPRSYGGRDDGEAADDEEDTEEQLLEESIRDFCAVKAREAGYRDACSAMPSRNNRGSIRAELASMGCAWGE